MAPESSAWDEYSSYLTDCIPRSIELQTLVQDGVGDEIDVTSRVKSTQTLREKLIRSPGLKLPSIDDVIGLRVVGDFTLSDQDRLAAEIAELLGGGLRERDRRLTPIAGYRALHVIVRTDLAHVEVQIRTRLQAEWADVYERLADTWGRQIRYGEGPDPDPSGVTEHRVSLIDDLQKLSLTDIASYEQAVDDSERRLAAESVPLSEPRRRNTHKSKADIVRAMKVRELEKSIAISDVKIHRITSEWAEIVKNELRDLAIRADQVD